MTKLDFAKKCGMIIVPYTPDPETDDGPLGYTEAGAKWAIVGFDTEEECADRYLVETFGEGPAAALIELLETT